tara:strand:+ start:2318 stop:4792 length:2475 start_codon:yes stop_codon:yes gene_type:complete
MSEDQDKSKRSELVAKEKRAKAQAYLLANLIPLSALSRGRGSTYNYIPYSNRSSAAMHLIDAPSEGDVLSKLVFDRNFSAFYTLTPDKISLLVPRITLYKVLHSDPAGNRIDPPIDFEVPFAAYTLGQDTQTSSTVDYTNYSPNTVQQTLTSIDMKGGGAGIKSFEWQYKGNNPASSRRDITAKLVLKFQSFEDLVKIRKVGFGSNTHDFRYSDLAMRTGESISGEVQPSHYKLRAVVGWGWSDGHIPDTWTAEEVKAVKSSKMGLFLTIINHSFNINDDATVDFTIDYRAYIEGAMTTPQANVLVTDELLKTQKERKDQEAKIAAAKDCSKEDLKKLKEHHAKSVVREKEQALRSLLAELDVQTGETTAESRIFVLSVPTSQLSEFALLGTGAGQAAGMLTLDPSFTNVGANMALKVQALDAEGQSTDQKLENVIPKTEMVPKDQNTKTYVEHTIINYFFLGDLVDIALKNITNPALDEYYKGAVMTPQEEFKQMRILLGPIRVIDPQTNIPYYINIGDIPISVESFVEFMTMKLLSKNETQYFVLDMIRQVVQQLVVGVLNSKDMFDGAYRQKANFSTMYLSGDDGTGSDPLNKLIKNNRINMDTVNANNADSLGLPLCISGESAKTENTYQYVYCYAKEPSPQGLSGDINSDTKNGIYHFFIGADRGILKRISFQKTDQKYVKEARWQQGGYDGLTQLREPYEINIELFGNSRLFPGQMIYVNPAGLGSTVGSPADNGSMAWLLGLGGYHMITQVDSYIEDGKFETKIKAKWIMRGGKGEQDPSLGTDTPPASGTQPTEYVACEELTAITGDTSGQSPTND